jgi:hypothetical protein
MDLFDSYLRKQIKIVAARYITPKNGREKLLAAASRLEGASTPQKHHNLNGWGHGRLHLRFSLNTVLALLQFLWPPVNTMPFIERPSTLSRRAFSIHIDSSEWSNGLLHMGLLCSSNSNSVGFHLRL